MTNLVAERQHAPRSLLYRRIVADTRNALTMNEIADITGVQPRSVQNWAAGASKPDGQKRDRLLELHYVVEQLLDVYDTEGAEIWLHRPQRALSHQRPLDALRDGRFEEVLGAVEVLAGGPKRG